MAKDTIKVVGTRSFPVFGLLGSTLIILKLLGYIEITWFWALAPFWIPFAVFFTVLAILFLLLMLVLFVAHIADRRS